MKAVQIHTIGGPEVLCYEDVPRPTVGKGEALVRVKATTVNPLDWKVRSGIFPLESPEDFPFTLGLDVAGEIEEIGSDAGYFAVGDAVYGLSISGGYAEYAKVLVADIAMKPRITDYLQAAALPCAAITAWQLLFGSANLKSGQSVLIHGAAGGVGTVAVQLAKWCGAHVIGTASAHNHDFLRQLGADEMIDYNVTRFEEVVHDIDLVFDIVGGETLWRSRNVLKPGGKLRTIADSSAPEIAANYGIDASGFEIHPPFGAVLREIAGLVDNGHLKPVVSTVLPFQEVQQAHRLSEGRHVRGKIVLVP